MLLIHEIRVPMGTVKEAVIEKAFNILGLQKNEVQWAKVHKISVDARRAELSFVYTIAFALHSAAEEEKLAGNSGNAVRLVQACPHEITPGTQPLAERAVVCGMGPAGMFAALELAQAGFAPLVLERGPDIETRAAAVEKFESGGEFSPEANIQFGEGGAGTFSDGKLSTRINDPLCAHITRQLLQAGAPEEIEWLAKPHIGTDVLRGVFLNLRKKLQSLGGEVCFNTQLTGFITKNGRLIGVKTNRGEIATGALVLAVGHSARDTFESLKAIDLPLEAKPFSVGFRAEHLQKRINEGLYHAAAGHPDLPVGEYQLSTKVGARGVYTFCMCPGGTVVAASSEVGGVVSNGMSMHSRGGKNANAAVVASVGPEDFGNDPFEAIRFQRELEQAAYKAAGSTYAAPAETMGSFLEGRGKLELGEVKPSYSRGVVASDLGSFLPKELTDALRTGISTFGRKLPGYAAADAVLTGLETRTSSPVRIPRAETLESRTLQGLWPCGEGAGYAGGIMSAAVDGVRVAKAIIERYCAPQK